MQLRKKTNSVLYFLLETLVKCFLFNHFFIYSSVKQHYTWRMEMYVGIKENSKEPARTKNHGQCLLRPKQKVSPMTKMCSSRTKVVTHGKKWTYRTRSGHPGQKWPSRTKVITHDKKWASRTNVVIHTKLKVF